VLGWPSGQTLFFARTKARSSEGWAAGARVPFIGRFPLPSPDAIMLICSLGRFRARLLAVAELQVSVLG
jgi:hypothetical protein